jgi:hypothetical protein
MPGGWAERLPRRLRKQPRGLQEQALALTGRVPSRSGASVFQSECEKCGLSYQACSGAAESVAIVGGKRQTWSPRWLVK